MQITKDEFIAFAEAVARNESDYSAWQRFAQTHYRDERVERARVEIVKVCIEDDSIGNSKWPVTDEAGAKILEVVASLRQELRDSE